MLTTFKNSVFAEFSDSKALDAFVKADPKPIFDGKELLVMTKSVSTYPLLSNIITFAIGLSTWP